MGAVEVNIGLKICSGRRWPEAWRVPGLQQVEVVTLGYNTPSLTMGNRGFEAHQLRVEHSHLSVRAGCYRNACFGVATAKSAAEDRHELFGRGIVVNPQGEIMAQTTSWGDGLIAANCGLGMCELRRRTIFDFAARWGPEAHRRTTEQVGSVAPPMRVPGS